MQINRFSYVNTVLIGLLFLMLSLFFKLVPHLPNFSPELAFSLYLLISARNKILGLCCAVAIWLACDISYGLLHADFPVFGSWSWFSYSALLIFFISSSFFRLKTQQNKSKLFLSLFAISSCVFYWLWTNLGVYWLSGLYPHNFAGFVSCFYLALPFLGYSLMSCVFWVITLCFLCFLLNSRRPVLSATRLAVIK